MEPRPAYALVGLFVVLLGGAIFAAAVWLKGTHSGEVTHVYVAYMTDSVTGLNVKSTVRYRGVRVGRVSLIELDPEDPGRVRLLLAIADGTPIKVDTVARLATQGITGLAYVELRGGSRDSVALQAAPGSDTPEIATEPSLLGRLDRAAPQLIEQVQSTVSRLGTATERINALFSDENLAAVTVILGDVQRLTSELAARSAVLGKGIDDLGRMLDSGVAVGERLPGIMARAEGTLAQLEKAGVAAGSASAAITRLAVRLDATIERISSRTLGEIERAADLTGQELQRFAVETQPRLLDLIEELRSAALSLRRIGSELERDPSLLLFGRREEPGPGEEEGQ